MKLQSSTVDSTDPTYRKEVNVESNLFLPRKGMLYYLNLIVERGCQPSPLEYSHTVSLRSYTFCGFFGSHVIRNFLMHKKLNATLAKFSPQLSYSW